MSLTLEKAMAALRNPDQVPPGVLDEARSVVKAHNEAMEAQATVEKEWRMATSLRAKVVYVNLYNDIFHIVKPVEFNDRLATFHLADGTLTIPLKQIQSVFEYMEQPK